MAGATRLFILLWTHIGSAQNMRQCMQEIIEISNSITHTIFFVTITCDLIWPKIRKVILPGQVPQDQIAVEVGEPLMKFQPVMSFIINKK